MKYLSLFSGIGGFELGIHQAYELSQMGIKSESSTNTQSSASQHSERPLCVGYSEIDKYAVQIYQKHFPDHHNYGDITKINEKELPDFELLCGGFPCQSFSIAGKRGGFNDTRGTMFFEIARILKAKQPRLLLLENVKGLLSHEEGRTFATIISTLDELGYDLQWQVLNSKNFGVPQNRERVFIVGHLRGTPRPQVFPFGEGSGEHVRKEGKTWKEGQRVRRQDLSAAIDANYHKGAGATRQMIRVGTIGKDSEATRVYDPNGVARTIKDGGGMGAKTGLYIIKRNPTYGNGNRTIKYAKSSVVPAIRSTMAKRGDNDPLVDYGGIRRLTPLECERLQGFPDNWTEGVSDTQRYKCLGNAVTVDVIREIVKKML